MKKHSALEKVYYLHSINQTKKDGRNRKYYFEIENLENDYIELRKTIKEYEPLSFDFVASCLYDQLPMVRFFSKSFTGRFSINSNISMYILKEKLLANGYIFIPKGKNSGPLCLNDDFSEPFSVKIFRALLPIWEFKLWLWRKFE